MSSSRETLRLQKALKQEGFYDGKIDGIWGPKSEKALANWRLWSGKLVRGIDVSRFQTDVNWKVVKRDGVAFAFIKATDGLGKDPLFEKNRKEAKEAGLIVGYYHFFRPNRDLEAQAENILKVVGKLGKGELGIAIDIELDDSGIDKIEGTADDIKATQEMMEKFVALVEKKTGKPPIIYSYGYYLLDHNINLPNYPLWIADYRSYAPTIVGSWKHYTFHQYAGNNGIQMGVKNHVDLNRFRGTLEELQKMAGF